MPLFLLDLGFLTLPTASLSTRTHPDNVEKLALLLDAAKELDGQTLASWAAAAGV